MDKEGKVYFSVSDANKSEKRDIIDDINTAKNLGLTDAEKKNFAANPTAYIGVPFSMLKSYLDKSTDQLKGLNLPGIPTQDSTNNELIDWMRATVQVSAQGGFNGGHMNLLVKGDDAAKYPAFQGVIIAFKKNDQLKFQLVTSPVSAPVGSELEKVQKAAGNKKVD